MAQVTRCPLTGASCSKQIIIQEKTFFLAEAEEPEYDKQHRRKAINLAIADGYKIRSALDEKGINAFSCKICEMIQTCAYGMADITRRNPNVLLELGMMIALGKPTIILVKKEQDKEIELFSDLKAIEVIPFEEYLDVVENLKEILPKLPQPIPPSSPINDIEKLNPEIAEEIKKQLDTVVKEFKESIKEAKLDTASSIEEKIEIPLELSERLRSLEEKIGDMRGLGFVTDAQTASLRGNYFYNQGKYDDAIAAYNWSLEIKPDESATIHNRGVTLSKLERYDEALADYNRSLEIGPDDHNTLNSRGITLSKLDRYDEALADFNRSLEIKPDKSDTLQNRGVTLAKLDRYDEALADYNHLLEISPDDPDTLYNLACLFSLWEKADEAMTYLEKAISKDEKYCEMAKTDKDFHNIREDSRFKKLLEPD